MDNLKQLIITNETEENSNLFDGHFSRRNI